MRDSRRSPPVTWTRRVAGGRDCMNAKKFMLVSSDLLRLSTARISGCSLKCPEKTQISLYLGLLSMVGLHHTRGEHLQDVEPGMD